MLLRHTWTKCDEASWPMGKMDKKIVPKVKCLILSVNTTWKKPVMLTRSIKVKVSYASFFSGNVFWLLQSKILTFSASIFTYPQYCILLNWPDDLSCQYHHFYSHAFSNTNRKNLLSALWVLLKTFFSKFFCSFIEGYSSVS